jgi:cell division septum initiation protein DivIVA
MSDRDTEASSNRQSFENVEEEELDREFFQTIRVPSINKESIINLSIARVREVRHQCNQLNSTVSDLRQCNTDLRTSNTELRSTIIEIRQSINQATQQSTETVNHLQTELQLLRESLENLKVQLAMERSRTVSAPTVSTQQASTATKPNNNTVSIPTVLIQQPSTTAVNQLQTEQQELRESMEELRVQLAVERSRTVSSVPPVVDDSPIVQIHKNTVPNPTIRTQQPSTTTMNNSNTVSTSTVPIQQPSTATTSIVQQPNIKASQPESFSGERVRFVGDWLAAVRRYLSLSGVEEKKWVAYAVTMLTSTALSWWNSIESSNPDKSTLEYSWDEFIELVRERFVPADSEALAMSKMSQWKQTGSVSSYINQFQSFDQLIPSHRLDEEMRVQMFMQGLKAECRLIINMWEPKTLQQVYKMALKFDNIQRQSLPKLSLPRSYQSNSTSLNLNRNRTANQQEGTKFNPITIYNTEIQKESQTTVSEDEEDENELNHMSGQNGQRGVCFFCKSPDHYQNTCPKLKAKRQTEFQTRPPSFRRTQSTSYSKN